MQAGCTEALASRPPAQAHRVLVGGRPSQRSGLPSSSVAWDQHCSTWLGLLELDRPPLLFQWVDLHWLCAILCGFGSPTTESPDVLFGLADRIVALRLHLAASLGVGPQHPEPGNRCLRLLHSCPARVAGTAGASSSASGGRGQGCHVVGSQE